MKKTLLTLTIVFISLFVAGCRTNRVWVEDDLRQIAFNDFGYAEYYFFKVVSPDTALALSGTSYTNGGVIAGRMGEFDRLIFVPKKTAEEPFLINFPYIFNLDDILNALALLEDDQGQPLYNVVVEDFGGLHINVETFAAIAEANPEITFDSQVVFSFTTGDEEWTTFHVLSSLSRIVIFSADYELLE